MTIEERKEQTIIMLHKVNEECEQIKSKIAEIIKDIEKAESRDDLENCANALDDIFKNLIFLDAK